MLAVGVAGIAFVRANSMLLPAWFREFMLKPSDSRCFSTHAKGRGRARRERTEVADRGIARPGKGRHPISWWGIAVGWHTVGLPLRIEHLLVSSASLSSGARPYVVRRATSKLGTLRTFPLARASVRLHRREGAPANSFSRTNLTRWCKSVQGFRESRNG